jgi:hypothetical protein
VDTDTGGPYLNIAAFCDEAVIGADGAVSLIRIIDTVATTATGDDPPDEMPPVAFRTKLVVTLKAGQARGRFRIKLRAEGPDGRQFAEQEQWVHFEGGSHAGVNVITQVQLGLELEGIYWFDVLFEPAAGAEQLLTRVPLLVQYLPQRTPGP